MKCMDTSIDTVNTNVSIYISQTNRPAIFVVSCFIPKYVFRFRLMFLIIMVREQAVFHKPVGVCHVYCNFIIGYMCQINAIFSNTERWKYSDYYFSIKQLF